MRSEREEPFLGSQGTWRVEEHQHYMPASGFGDLAVGSSQLGQVSLESGVFPKKYLTLSKALPRFQ